MAAVTGEEGRGVAVSTPHRTSKNGSTNGSASLNLNLVEAINQALHLAMERDSRVVVMGEDVGRNGGVFRATDGLWQRFGPERVIDTPLAESVIVGAAVGMAAFGLRPVAEIQFEGFTYLAFDQLVTQAARLRNRSRGRFRVPLVLRAPHGGGVRAPEHHSEAPEALYAHVPGLQVVIPSNPCDAKGLLLAALQQDDPVIFFEPKRIYRAFRQSVPQEAYTVPIGAAAVVREGHDVTVVSWGASVHSVLDVIAKHGVDDNNSTDHAASADGIGHLDVDAVSHLDVELIDLRSLKPWDEETVLHSVEKTGRLVVVQEAWQTGGFGSEIISRVAQKALYSLQAPPVLVGGWDIPVPLAQLEREQLPSSVRIRAALAQVMQG
ncbi:MAG: alpha-ketoacid dehydrogenase subunit beta [Limnochordaceae bacterium]|nr:alpha-ketoacid dehydrogenase subunit beta [Limnochordaceae bacterium]